MSYNPITGQLNKYSSSRAVPARTPHTVTKQTTFKKTGGFMNHNEELNFAKYCSGFGSRKKRVKHRRTDPLGQFAKKEQKTAEKPKWKPTRSQVGNILATTFDTKISSDQLFKSKARGEFNDQARKKPGPWKPSIKVDNSKKNSPIKDDLTSKRGKKKVSHNIKKDKCKDPITQEGRPITSPKKKRTKPEYSTHTLKMNKRKHFELRSTAKKPERLYYESMQAKRKNKVNGKITKKRPNGDGYIGHKHTGSGAKDLMSYSYAPKFKTRKVTGKVNETDRVSLKKARVETFKISDKKHNIRNNGISSEHIDNLKKF